MICSDIKILKDTLIFRSKYSINFPGRITDFIIIQHSWVGDGIFKIQILSGLRIEFRYDETCIVYKKYRRDF